jgi:hypothetical protein
MSAELKNRKRGIHDVGRFDGLEFVSFNSDRKSDVLGARKP